MKGMQQLRRLTLVLAAALALNAPVLKADHGGDNNNNQGQNEGGHHRAQFFRQTNLVSDQAGKAMLQDTNLVNAWGISYGPTTPFWISDNGTGETTLYIVKYDAMGNVQVSKAALFVNIPGDGTPSGQVFNGTTGFNGDLFIFVSEDGTVSGWRPALGTTPGVMAETLVPGSDANVYKGVTLAEGPMGSLLLAANFRAGTVDVYDNSMPTGQLTLMVQLQDPAAPAGFAPFNVANVHGTIYVTFAKQDDAKHDDVAGRGNGLIDTLDLQTGMFTLFAAGSNAGGHLHQINSPWGMTIAPASFGRNAGDLLVGNFGSGTIMSFDPMTHQFNGLLRRSDGDTLAIDGLWALTVGNGGNGGRPSTVYFTAGPDGESHGLFGSLDPASEGEDD